MSQFHYKSLSLSEPAIELTVHIPGDENPSPTVENSLSAHLQSPVPGSPTIGSTSQANLTKRSKSFREDRENGEIHESVDLNDAPQPNGEKPDSTPEGKQPHPWSWSHIVGRLKAHMKPHRKVGDTPSVWSSIKAITLTSCTIPRCNKHTRSRSMMIFDHI